MKFLKNPWFKVLLILLISAAVFLTLRLLNINFSALKEAEFKEWVKALGFWSPAIYIAVYILRPLIFFPASILSATAGIIWGPALGFFYLQIAANLSSAAEFLIARYFARDLIEKYLKGKFSNLDAKIRDNGFLTVLLIRLVPNVAWDIQNFGLGLTKVKPRDYFLATFIGIMPGSFAFVFFGASLIKVLFNPRNFWVIAAAILFFIGIFYLQKALKKQQSEI